MRTCVMGDSAGDMVGDSCLARPRRCSLPGDSVRGLMGAGRRLGELLDRRRDELMEGLLSDDCSWQLLRDAWMDGLLSEDDRPAGTAERKSSPCTSTGNRVGRSHTWKLSCSVYSIFQLVLQPQSQNTSVLCAGGRGEGRDRRGRKELIVESQDGVKGPRPS